MISHSLSLVRHISFISILLSAGYIYPASSPGQYFFSKIESSPYLEPSGEIESFADELFAQGEYELAVHEYKREIIASDAPQEKMFRLALSLIRAGDIPEAKDVLNELLSADYYELGIKAGRLLGFIHYRDGNYLMGRYEFSNLLSCSVEQEFVAEWHYWLGWGYLLTYNFPSADSQFNIVVQPEFQSTHFYPSAYLLLKNIRRHTDQLPYRSPGLARCLSAIFPGLGQAYTGNYTDAVASFIINLVSGYLTVSSLLDRDYFQTLIYYCFLWNRYYLGSRDNAYRLAVEFNEAEREKFVKALMDAHLKW